MLSITSQKINSQKREIRAFAFNQFKANFISVMNGKNMFLERSNFNYAHLRFTKSLDIHSNNSASRVEKYEDTYVYFTTSTTTDKKSKLKQKIEENLSDRCFNIRVELLRKDPLMKCNYIFLVDLGQYFAYVDLDYARTHVVRHETYEGREIAVVRLPNRFFKKTAWCQLDELDEEGTTLRFDATYLQHVTYTNYRKRNGFIKVEVYKKGELQAIKYYVSTGALYDEAKLHGYNKTKDYLRILANKSGSFSINEIVYKLSKVNNISDTSTIESGSTFQTSQESGLPLQSSLNIYINNTKNVMVNQTIQSDIEPSSNERVDEFGDPIVKYVSKSQVKREVDYWNTELD